MLEGKKKNIYIYKSYCAEKKEKCFTLPCRIFNEGGGRFTLLAVSIATTIKKSKHKKKKKRTNYATKIILWMRTDARN